MLEEGPGPLTDEWLAYLLYESRKTEDELQKSEAERKAESLARQALRRGKR